VIYGMFAVKNNSSMLINVNLFIAEFTNGNTFNFKKLDELDVHSMFFYQITVWRLFQICRNRLRYQYVLDFRHVTQKLINSFDPGISRITFYLLLHKEALMVKFRGCKGTKLNKTN